MTHLSDKELDRLSRDASEQFDVDQNTSGWDVLEHMIDQELPIDKKKKRRPFFFLLLFFVLLGGTGLVSLFVYYPVTDQPVISLNSYEKSAMSKSIDEISTGNEEVSTITDEERNQNSNLRVQDSVSAVKVAKKTDDGAMSKPQGISRRKNINSVIRKNFNSEISSSNLTKSKLQKNPRKIEKYIALSNNEQKDISLGIVRKQPTFPILSTFIFESLKGPQVVMGSALLTEQMLLNRDVIKAQQSIPSKKLSKKASPLNPADKGFFLGMAAGPDKSNVNFNTSSEPGFNLGIIAGYRFTRKWSLNTGILYTKKAYTALGEDFYPPKLGWFNSIEIKSVEGDCVMFDIPITIRFNLLALPKTKLFISTGLSTYFMTQETYDYHYTYSGTYGRREMIYRDMEVHPFSIINLSAGIEQTLHKKISLQAEPYLKTPFNGVGFGNIRLNSIGAYLSLKYNW